MLFRRFIPNKKKSRRIFKTMCDYVNAHRTFLMSKENMLNKKYKMYMQNSDKIYITLQDFMNFIEDDSITTEDILNSCRTLAEIQSGKIDYIDVWAISEDNHIILCADKTKCKQHKDSTMSKIRISTIQIKE